MNINPISVVQNNSHYVTSSVNIQMAINNSYLSEIPQPKEPSFKQLKKNLLKAMLLPSAIVASTINGVSDFLSSDDSGSSGNSGSNNGSDYDDHGDLDSFVNRMYDNY